MEWAAWAVWAAWTSKKSRTPAVSLKSLAPVSAGAGLFAFLGGILRPVPPLIDLDDVAARAGQAVDDLRIPPIEDLRGEVVRGHPLAGRVVQLEDRVQVTEMTLRRDPNELPGAAIEAVLVNFPPGGIDGPLEHRATRDQHRRARVVG